MIRTHVDQISQTKRATQGVRIIRLRPDQKVSTIALVPRQEEEEIEEVDQSPFIQETMDVTAERKVVEVSDLEPEEIEEEDDEVITTDSLFDE